MKFKLFTVLAAMCFLIACGSDDSCTQADWIGTYSGTTNCDDGEPAEDTTIVVSAGATENTLNVDGNEIAFDGCKFSITEMDPFFGIEITSNYELDGNTLRSEASFSLFGISVSCTFEGTK